MLVELEILGVAVYAKTVLKGDVEHVRKIEQKVNGPEDRALQNASHNSWRDNNNNNNNLVWWHCHRVALYKM